MGDIGGKNHALKKIKESIFRKLKNVIAWEKWKHIWYKSV